MGLKSFISSISNFFSLNEKRANYPLYSNYSYSDYYSENITGEPVTISSAQKISTVYTCINVISQDIAKLPFDVLQDSDKGTQKKVKDPIYRLIHTRPNEYTTAFNFWYSIMNAILTKGNGLAIVMRDESMNPTQLIQVDWYNVTILQNGTELFYQINGVGTLPARDVLHFKMFTIDGINGLSPIMWNAYTMGYKMKQDRYSAQALGTKGTGFISSQGLNMEQGQQVVAAFKSAIRNGEMPFLATPGDTKWHNQMITPNEAQYIETKVHTNTDIYGIFRIPPVFAQNMDGATYANAAQQDLVYVKHTLTPWIKMIEQECDYKLFRESNNAKSFPLYTEFNLNGILRGDAETRFKIYHDMILDGVYSADEVRMFENMPPQPDGLGKKYYMQGAMIEKGTNPNENESTINGRSKELEQLLQNEN